MVVDLVLTAKRYHSRKYGVLRDASTSVELNDTRSTLVTTDSNEPGVVMPISPHDNFEQYMTSICSLRHKDRWHQAQYSNFSQYCAREYSQENLFCVADIVSLELLLLPDEQHQPLHIVVHWNKIVTNYVQHSAPLEVNLPNEVRELALRCAPDGDDASFSTSLRSLKRAVLVNCYDTYCRFNTQSRN